MLLDQLMEDTMAQATSTRTMTDLVAEAAAEAQAEWLAANPGKFETMAPAEVTALFAQLGREAKTVAARRYSVILTARTEAASKAAGKPMKVCHNCGSNGTTMYKHIEGGRCFTCDGSGFTAIR